MLWGTFGGDLGCFWELLAGFGAPKSGYFWFGIPVLGHRFLGAK
jgi:hypothetical protein